MSFLYAIKIQLLGNNRLSTNQEKEEMQKVVASKPNINLGQLVGKTIILSTSGALSPGPLSAAAIALGAVYGFMGGIFLAIGHMIVEAPYVYILFLGFEKVSSKLHKFKRIMSIIVGGFMLFFAAGIITLGIKGALLTTSNNMVGSSIVFSIVSGAMLTAFNPYFLAWWLTVGQPLIEESSKLGRKGFSIMYGSHVWMDYAWLLFLAIIGTGAVLNMLIYRVVMLSVGVVLVYYGIKYLYLATK